MNYNENKPTTAMLSHESLDVYQLSLKFHLGVMSLLPQRGSPTLRDQLERASTSPKALAADHPLTAAVISSSPKAAPTNAPQFSTFSASATSPNPLAVSTPAITQCALRRCWGKCHLSERDKLGIPMID